MKNIHPNYLNKSEDEETYKRFAAEGMDLMHPVRIKGKSHRPDINVPYHATIKLFDTSKDKPEQAHEVASKLSLNPPNAKEVGIEPTTLKGRTGYTMHVFKLHGPHADALKEHHKKFSHLGYKETYDYHPHITVDKETWDNAVHSKAKTAHDAGIEFMPAELHHKTSVVASYKPKIAQQPGGDKPHSDKLSIPEKFQKSEAPQGAARGTMQITPGEIDTIEEAGILDQSPVKLIRTKGGFWIAIGKPKGRMREEALAAGSHPAIVKFNLEKQYPAFQPSMMKSEYFSDNCIVKNHSHFMSEELLKSGHDIYSVQTDDKIEFQITKHGSKVSSIDADIEKGYLVIKGLSIPKEFGKALAGAAVEKANSCGTGFKFVRK